jgi:hypothetical protein
LFVSSVVPDAASLAPPSPVVWKLLLSPRRIKIAVSARVQL